jgi:hypothetical protein
LWIPAFQFNSENRNRRSSQRTVINATPSPLRPDATLTVVPFGMVGAAT